jgi:hypothetical protein
MHDSRLDLDVDDIILDSDDFQDSVSEFYGGAFNYVYDENQLVKKTFDEGGIPIFIDTHAMDTISVSLVGVANFEFENVEALINALQEHQEFKKLNMTPEEIETAFDAYESQIAQMKAFGRNWQE